MRKKELKLVVTFHTTADAMAMEKACKEQNASGRIIPVPRAISAGCGLSWCAELSDKEQIVKVMQSVGIQEEEMHECMVYLFKVYEAELEAWKAAGENHRSAPLPCNH